MRWRAPKHSQARTQSPPRCSVHFSDVASVCFKCFRCFICMLQVFHVDVAKSRSGCCICCNGYTRMLQAFVPNVLAISDGCCTCFICVLHMFHTYVASVSSECCIYFHTYVESVSSRCCVCFAMSTHVFPSCFERMLQMFPLDIAKIDLVLHMLQWTPSIAVTCCS